MKSILISIKPKFVAKILNGDKTIEIRKTAPKCDLPIDVYIYCTKTIKPLSDYGWGDFTFDDLPKLGKVVAKFRLMEVEKIIYDYDEREEWYATHSMNELKLYERSGLDYEQIDDYMNGKPGYAWHISDLVIFDEPKELEQFEYLNPSGTRNVGQRELNGKKNKKHPPQSWCYVEELK